MISLPWLTRTVSQCFAFFRRDTESLTRRLRGPETTDSIKSASPSKSRPEPTFVPHCSTLVVTTQNLMVRLALERVL
jgi:hypothetical protein